METIIAEHKLDNSENKLRTIYSLMLKGSNSAKYLSLIYALTSFILAFKYREELMYSIVLIVSGMLILGYAIKYLWLKGVKPTTDSVEELISKVKVYKEQTLKREKYEHFVMTAWMLTLVPWYLEGKEIAIWLVISLLVVYYFFNLFGAWAFARVKKQLKEMDSLVDEINATRCK